MPKERSTTKVDWLRKRREEQYDEMMLDTSFHKRKLAKEMENEEFAEEYTKSRKKRRTKST